MTELDLDAVEARMRKGYGQPSSEVVLKLVAEMRRLKDERGVAVAALEAISEVHNPGDEFNPTWCGNFDCLGSCKVLEILRPFYNGWVPDYDSDDPIPFSFPIKVDVA